jgi:UDP-3-O-[3-hydroxymyristoyl] N-acetylglucosamine deacetylase
MKHQQTIAAPFDISGQALHSGVMVNMSVLPAPPESGIRFRRSDIPGSAAVLATPDAVLDTQKSMTIGTDEWRIATIEHLLSVFHGLGVDNALVEVDGPELPLGDGSGRFFVDRVLTAGLQDQEMPRRYRRIQTPLWVEGTVARQGQPSKALIIALPAERMEVSFTFTSDHPATGTQYFHFVLDEMDYAAEIAPARTIAFMKEIEYLRSQGLALADDLNCAVIVGENGYQNELRFPEEIVRHKIMDLMGDIYLAGPIKAHFIAVRSGHALDLALAKQIAQLPRETE